MDAAEAVAQGDGEEVADAVREPAPGEPVPKRDALAEGVTEPLLVPKAL